MTRRRLTERSVAYHTSYLDRDISEIAVRYLTTPDRIVSVTPNAQFRTPAGATPPNEVTLIQLPLSDEDMELEWDDHHSTEATLSELCAAMNAHPLRAGMRPVEVQQLWLHPLNADTRARLLEGLIPDGPESARSQRDARVQANDDAPGPLRLPAGTVFQFPFPHYAEGRAVRAAPNASGVSAPAESAYHALPDWAVELIRDHLEPLERVIAQVHIINVAREGLHRECITECRPLVEMHNIFQYIESRGTAPDMRALGIDLNGLVNVASREVCTSFFDYIERAANLDYGNLASRLHGALRAARFCELGDQALQAGDVELRLRSGAMRTLRSWVLTLLGDGYAELSRVPHMEQEIQREIDAALEQCGSGRRESTLLGTAMGRIVAPSEQALSQATPDPVTHWDAALALSSMLTTSVGNLPGPASLASALMQVRLAQMVARVMNSTAPQLQAEVGRLAGLLARIIGGDAAWSARLHTALYPAAGGAADVSALRAIATEVHPQLYQTGRGWASAVGLFSLLGLVATFAGGVHPFDPDHPNSYPQVAFWVSVFGGSVNTAIGGLSALQLIRPGGTWASLAGWGSSLTAGLSVIVGAWRLWDGLAHGDRGDLTGQVLAGAQVAASALILIPFAPLQIAGAAAGVVLTAVDILNRMDAMYMSETKRVMLALLTRFQAGPRVTQINRRSPSLDPAIQNLRRTLTRADVPALPRTPEVQQGLRARGFADSYIQILTTPMGQPREIYPSTAGAHGRIDG